MMISIIVFATIILNIQLTLGQISESTKCTSSQLTSCAYSQIRCPPNYYFNGQYCLPLQAPTQQPESVTQPITKCSAQPPRVPNTVSPTIPDPLPVKPVCEPYYEWNGQECYHVSSNDPICPPGHNLTAYGQCVSIVQAVCQENYHLNGDFCVGLLEAPVYCPEGYDWDGTKCLYRIDPSCPDGFVLNNGYCELIDAGSCPRGTIMNNFKCIGHHQVEIQCDYGYSWDGLNCVNSTDSCEIGFELRGDMCEKYIIKLPEFECPPRTEMIGNQCVSAEKICPKGFTLIDTVCVEQVSSTNQTETFIVPNCTTGYELVGCECVQINETISRPPTPICPPNYVYRDGLCYYEQGHYPPVCPTNYEVRNGVCVPLRPDTTEIPKQNCTQTNCQSNHTSTCSCPIGYTLNNNGLCILTGQASKVCPPGYKLINEVCVLITTPNTCPPGYNFSNGSCLQPVHVVPPCEVVCPVNTELINGICTITTDFGTDDCPPGYRKDNGNCVPSNNPDVNPCPPGYIWKYGICKPELPCLDRCPPGYSWINESCVNFTIVIPTQPGGTDPTKIPPTLPPIIPTLPPIIQPCPPTNQNTSCQPCPTNNLPCQPCQSNPPCQSCPPNNTPCQPCSPCTQQPCKTSDQTYPPANSNCSNCPQTTHYITKDGHISITNIVNVAHHHQAPPSTQNRIFASENIDESFDYDTTGQNATDGDDDTTRKCCEITTPRQCKRTGDEWTCFHKKYQRCGDICTQPKIYLKPKMIHYQPPILIMPPPPSRRFYGRRRMHSAGAAVDCSGCIHGGYRCSVECYSYPDCRRPDCAFIDQDSYCEEWGHDEGCSADDGYFE